MATRRTTHKHYERDLGDAKALFDEKTQFAYCNLNDPLIDEHDKSLNDALNNEWELGITVDAWVERVLTEWGIGGRRAA